MPIAPSAEGTLVFPGNQGGTNWYSPSYSPRTGLFYIPTWVDYDSTYTKRPVEYVEGQRFTGALPRCHGAGGMQPATRSIAGQPEEGYGAIQAVDPRTGEKKWEFKMADVTDGGVLTTASDLLFSGGREGYFFALDARSGALLWKAKVGGQSSRRGRYPTQSAAGSTWRSRPGTRCLRSRCGPPTRHRFRAM